MIKDQKEAEQILDLMNTMLEAAEQWYLSLEGGNDKLFQQLHSDLLQVLAYLEQVAPRLCEEEDGLNLKLAVPSVLASFQKIRKYAEADVERALHKIEFELLPLIEEMRMQYYFWGCVYPDKGRMAKYYREELYKYSKNIYIEEAEKTGIYKYQLSIYVLAYNNLNYTKMCVEHLLRYIPEKVSYEIILINHGSNDGTKEYFESIHPDKQLDIEVNGGGLGAITRIVEGKYSLAVSNDVLMTENVISNLLCCMEQDDKVAWAVPATPNVSNLQDIFLRYDSLEDMEREAKENNSLDPYRWEQRVRLCNPVDIRRNAAFDKLGISGYMVSKNRYAFPDDLVSLLCRRNGYKLILLKDSYCHHFGSLTIKNQWKKSDADDVYLQGRIEFYKYFGVDPWNGSHCYEPKLFEWGIFDKTGPVNVLGINCGFGSNSLKIKESLKENVHNLQVTVYDYTEDKSYIKDLGGISDHVAFLKDWRQLQLLKAKVSFDYVLVQDGLEKLNKNKKMIRVLTELAADKAYLILSVQDPELREWIKSQYPDTVEMIGEIGEKYWLCWQKNEKGTRDEDICDSGNRNQS